MSERKRPIHSLLEDEPRLQEEISEFVVRLAERIDGLQDAHSAGDFSQLASLATELASLAERYGYPALAGVVSDVRRGAIEQRVEEARKSVEEATEIARCIRLGHRGAA